MVIDIKNIDVSGRGGVLDIDGIKIKTPNYLPNQKDINSLIKSPFVNGHNFPNVNVGTYTKWLDSQKIVLISENLENYKKIKYALRSEIKKMDKAGVKRKLLHFEFYNDVLTLSGKQLDILLKLQAEVGADVIEIPNKFSIDDYKRVLDRADKWRRSEGIEKELMGIANSGSDIEMLKDKTEIISCVGANLKKEDRPLLNAIRDYLKQEDIWVHAHSVPRSYSAVGWNGTLSVLLNYYGVDTISTAVGNPKGARRFILEYNEMNEEQKMDVAQDSRYFNPIDYSTLQCRNIVNDTRLSNFCNCPVCQENSVDTIVKNTTTANANIRSHEVFAYQNESSNYQTEIKKNLSNDYFNSKKYATEIASLFRTQS
ncbi:hypothetical protein MSLAZ_2399 [Methanosarcina lacustris Z-7289]|uniref:Archaeosine tRNA-ribosyltransferase type 2 n=1 Tax=Methanosarcina lacustris Z-7289 TaxID=1434111 RepID=A0A0E3WRU4_9EURY|nr:hypothetical protein [Methanosarcina lacustris]AKB75660.1 hypothetical protein MSLAZ_2399 [Methanosarcina lacustris Z-7289]